MGRKLVTPLILIIGLYLIVSFSRSIWSLWQKTERIKEAQKSAKDVQIKSEELKKELEFVQTPAYIEKMAREKLNLAKPGETIVILPPISLEDSEKNSSPPPLPNWKKWWGLFF